MDPLYVGIDAGATKVEAIAISGSGRQEGRGLQGPANHHYIGIPKVMERLRDAVKEACGERAVAHAVFGLAGADLPEDFDALKKALKETFPFPLTLTNDIDIAFRAGTDSAAGGVIIGGTGANAALCTPDGTWHRIRAMGYQTGCGGGSLEMIRDCLHVAYQSDEGTGPRSGIEGAVLDAYGAANLDALVGSIREVEGDKEALSAVAKKLMPSLFSLAKKGDVACQDILIAHGSGLGQVLAGICRRVGYTEDLQEVVLTGGLFNAQSQLFVDAIALEVHRAAPNARLVRNTFPPAFGGALLALEADGKGKDPARRKAFSASSSR